MYATVTNKGLSLVPPKDKNPIETTKPNAPHEFGLYVVVFKFSVNITRECPVVPGRKSRKSNSNKKSMAHGL